ncbi:hypothetical protein [Rhodanobacter sp. FW106-PBR-LB-2-19]|uniref:hypothetical protein n=1 Tax=Rhodanobacter sp. FW106-PBR-LB-2-19 TaxID=2766737 RepID=UPI0034E432FF
MNRFPGSWLMHGRRDVGRSGNAAPLSDESAVFDGISPGSGVFNRRRAPGSCACREKGVAACFAKAASPSDPAAYPDPHDDEGTASGNIARYLSQYACAKLTHDVEHRTPSLARLYAQRPIRGIAKNVSCNCEIRNCAAQSPGE